jgi:hypothetical protein
MPLPVPLNLKGRESKLPRVAICLGAGEEILSEIRPD